MVEPVKDVCWRASRPGVTLRKCLQLTAVAARGDARRTPSQPWPATCLPSPAFAAQQPGRRSLTNRGEQIVTRARYTLAIALSALALTACGGGGDDPPRCTDPTAPGCGPGNTNQTPTANANGPYTGTVGNEVLFNSSGTRDPDGSIAKYE